jgi:hypothetical protein
LDEFHGAQALDEPTEAKDNWGEDQATQLKTLWQHQHNEATVAFYDGDVGLKCIHLLSDWCSMATTLIFRKLLNIPSAILEEGTLL